MSEKMEIEENWAACETGFAAATTVPGALQQIRKRRAALTRNGPAMAQSLDSGLSKDEWLSVFENRVSSANYWSLGRG